MVKNQKKLREFEIQFVKRSKPCYKNNLKIVEALWRHAVKMQRFPPKDKLVDIESDIKFAKAINSVR
jgi:hypothetical protein